MRPVRLLVAPLTLASLAAGCGHDRRPVPPAAIAVVGDRTIPRAQFAALIDQARQSYRSRGRAFPAAGTAAYRRLKRLAVDLLVEQAELEQEAPRLGVAVAEGQVQERLERLKEDAFGGSEQRYRARLRAAGLTDAQVRASIRTELLVAAVRQAVTAETTVGEQAVQDDYEQHADLYAQPARRTIQHILVATRRFAGELAARLRSGASFAAVARRYSRDPRTRELGGRMALVQGRTSPSLDRVAFSLGTGGTSEPFRTAFGWEIVRALGAVEPARMTPFAAVKAGIRRRLLVERRAQTFQRWLDGVRARYAGRTVFAAGFSPVGGS